MISVWIVFIQFCGDSRCENIFCMPNEKQTLKIKNGKNSCWKIEEYNVRNWATIDQLWSYGGKYQIELFYS